MGHILSNCYTFKGDQKSLFPSSKCCFHVCSISGDEIFTDCLDDAKCLIVWSLNDGREITRVIRNETIVSFAMSRDGKLLAISHLSGCVGLVDRENGFTTLAMAALECVTGFIRFAEDSRFLYCGRWLPLASNVTYCQLCVSVDAQRNFSLDFTDVPLKPLESECDSVGGFLLGDPLSSEELVFTSDFVLNRQSLLRNKCFSSCIEMIYRNKVTESADGEYLVVEGLALSSTGETIFITVSSNFFTKRIMAWEVSNWKLKTEKEFTSDNFVIGGRVLVARGGVLIATSRTLELWNFELSYCIRQWSLYVASMFAISDDQVLCTTSPDAEQIIVDTVTGDVVPTLAVNSYKLIACYRNLHLLAKTDSGQTGCIKLQQLGESVPRWKFSLSVTHPSLVSACFSPKGQVIVVVSSCNITYVLDVFSGNVRLKLSVSDYHRLLDFKFVSDEEIVILSCHSTGGVSLRLFSVRSGNILSVLPVYSRFSFSYLSTCPSEGLYSRFSFSYLSTCPSEGLIAICSTSQSDLKVIKVKLSKEQKCIRNGRKVSWQIVHKHFEM